MIFQETPLAGSFVVDVEPHGDTRGSFARVFCVDELREQGLVHSVHQASVSFSVARGTLRGMHYALEPQPEVKLVRCIRGAIHDVILDVRKGSPSFGESFAAELSVANGRMLYIPAGFAHGFLTLEDATEVLYFIDRPYAPALQRGIRWNDPEFGIEWPFAPEVMSDRDAAFPDFDPTWHLGGGG